MSSHKSKIEQDFYDAQVDQSERRRLGVFDTKLRHDWKMNFLVRKLQNQEHRLRTRIAKVNEKFFPHENQYPK
jgi:hypothetical protein